MSLQSDAFARRQQARWMKPNAARWVRPDAARFLKPHTKPEDVYPAFALKYSEDQPRVPAGEEGGGQWTNADGKWGDAQEQALADGLDSFGTIVIAARRSNAADCDAQYKLDTFKCNLVRTPLCWAQAAERYSACLAGRSIPPLNF